MSKTAALRRGSARGTDAVYKRSVRREGAAYEGFFGIGEQAYALRRIPPPVASEAMQEEKLVRSLLVENEDLRQRVRRLDEENHWLRLAVRRAEEDDVKGDEEARWPLVYEALADTRWEFRTIEGIARTTGLSDVVVRRLVHQHAGDVRTPIVPDARGRNLYTLASRRPSSTERYLRLRALLTRRSS